MNFNKKKKVLLTLCFYIVVVITSFYMLGRPTFADSGFDASYSGGDYSSSSDSYSSSSYDSSDYSSYSSGSSSSSSGPVSPARFFFAIVFTIFIVCLPLILDRRSKTKAKNKFDASYKEMITRFENEAVAEAKVWLPDFDKKEFLDEAFDIYKRVQIAWMNFDLDSVKDVITDEMYNMYSSQLETLKTKGEQNIMENITLTHSHLSEVTEQNGNITIAIVFEVTQNDYIINQKTKAVLRGRKNTPMHMIYSLKFTKYVSSDHLDKCPNCGAELHDHNVSSVCEYCGSKIVTYNDKWVLTQKNAVHQSY